MALHANGRPGLDRHVRPGSGRGPIRHAWAWDVTFLCLIALVGGPVTYLAVNGWFNGR